MKKNMITRILGMLFTVLFCMACTSIHKQGEVVDASAFGLKPDTGKDASGFIRKALEYCVENGAAKLIIKPGRYDFYPEQTFETYLFISNNHDGLKSVAFFLKGMANFEISAPGAQFVFHGYTLPFVLENCRNVKLAGFSIDFARTFQSEGDILSVESGKLEVSFPIEYPFKVENERLKFYDETGRTEYPFGNLLEFDPVRKETAYMARDYYVGNNLKAEQTGPRSVRLYIPEIQGKTGNKMVFAPNHRLVPNIVAHQCEDIEVDSITMYNSGGMGFIAQMSKNLTVRKMIVTPPSGKVVSCTADATHFSNCTGKIRIEDCLFENQMDDATNIHGIYMRIEKVLTPYKLLVRLVHHEQLGMDIFSPEDSVEVVDAKTMVTYAHARIDSVKRLNKDFTEIIFSDRLPEKIKINDVVGTMVTPDVVLKNTVCRRNRARGVLLGSRTSILVEGCTFHIGGAAIMTGGDSQYWFEQGGVSNMTIRNNIFDNCMFGNWGRAVISMDAGEEPEPAGALRFNRNVTVENNEFRLVDPRIVSAVSVDGFIFRNNKIIRSDDYPFSPQQAEPFIMERSVRVDIEKE